MRLCLASLFATVALSNMACATLMAPKVPGQDCTQIGSFSADSSGPALDPAPTGGTKESHAAAYDAWKKVMNDRYVALKTDAFKNAQKKVMDAGGTHVAYADPAVVPQPDKSLKATANLFAYKCPNPNSFPNKTVPIEDPIREQHGSALVK